MPLSPLAKRILVGQREAELVQAADLVQQVRKSALMFGLGSFCRSARWSGMGVWVGGCYMCAWCCVCVGGGAVTASSEPISTPASNQHPQVQKLAPSLDSSHVSDMPASIPTLEEAERRR